MTLNDIAILKTKNADYRCIITRISESDCKTLIWLNKVEHYKCQEQREVLNLLKILIIF